MSEKKIHKMSKPDLLGSVAMPHSLPKGTLFDANIFWGKVTCKRCLAARKKRGKKRCKHDMAGNSMVIYCLKPDCDYEVLV